MALLFFTILNYCNASLHLQKTDFLICFYVNLSRSFTKASLINRRDDYRNRFAN